MSFFTYLKDTRAELQHVAWPTRTQTIQYTMLVVAFSVLVAFYFGFFDFLFTTALARGLRYAPQSSSGITVTPISASSSNTIISTSTAN